MGAETKQEYSFGGLDTRTNNLYKKEGKASDCRNVLLDENRRLVKVKDRLEIVIPRGAEDEDGTFLDKMPYTSVIIDLMPYKDHIVLATKVPWLHGLVNPTLYVNRFYKYFENTNTLEFIPFQKETYVGDTKFGQMVNKVASETDGKFTTVNTEGILYFMGGFADYDTSQIQLADTKDQLAAENNLGSMFAYDGKVITFAGVADSIKDTTQDEGTQPSSPQDATDRYARLLPIKIDFTGRHTLGNYSTHLTEKFAGKESLIIDKADEFGVDNMLDNSFDYACFVRLTSSSTSVQSVPEAGDTAARTIGAVSYSRQSPYQSVDVGQFLYGVSGFYDSSKVISHNSVYIHQEIYRCEVEAVDYGGNTITIKNFFKYSLDSGIWEPSATFQYLPAFSRYLSNTLLAVYTSRDFTHGFKYSTMTTWGYNGVSQLTTELFDSEFLGDPVGLTINSPTPLLYLSTEFSDIYDIETVKLPPPKGLQIRDYLGALALIDHDNFYFSDFSVGGTVENFTPSDNFKVGSTKRGKIVSFFCNETFIAVHREEEAYYITGNVFLSNYRVQSYKSTRIGGTDARSVIEFRGAGIFLSKRGFYMCQQGGRMDEISDSIETLFTKDVLNLDLDLTNCKSTIDYENEYIYCHIASTSATAGYVLAYSYYHREWYLLDGINGSGAFEVINNNLYSSDGINIFKDASTRLDALAFYRSTYETLGRASFPKKFFKVLLYTIAMPESFEFGIKTYKNWKSDVQTDQTKSISVNDSDVEQKLNPQRVKSMAFEIVSPAGQPLILDGYEYTYSSDIGESKDDNK